MSKKDALFDLIKSLNKTEKRYFKLWTTRNGSKEDKYIKLFNAIDKQKQYDEKKMLQPGNLEGSVKKNFRFNKHYLYYLILRSLNSFHSNSSIDADLKNILHSIEILYEKGLFEQCDKLILKGKKVAEQYENHLCHLNFLKWDIDLMRSRSHIGLTKPKIKKVYQQVSEVIKQCDAINKCTMLNTLISIGEQKKGAIRNQKDRNVIRHLHLTTLTNSNNLSYNEKQIAYSTKYKLASISENHKEAYNFILKQVILMENNPHQIKETPIQYISALNNLVIAKKRLGQFDVEDIIKKFKRIPSDYGIKSTRIKNTVFYRACNLELDIYAHTGEFNKGVNVINEIKNELNNSHLKVINKERELVLHYNIALIFFGSEDYPSANLYLNKIINDDKTDLRGDIYSFARILQLIIHYEMGNQDLIEYMVRSTYSFLLKEKKINNFEKAILNFIKKTSAINSKKETIFAFKEFKAELLEIIKRPFEKKILDYFDFISWLDAKIENKKYGEIIKRKISNN